MTRARALRDERGGVRRRRRVARRGTGLDRAHRRRRRRLRARAGASRVDAALDKVFDRFVDVWQAEANVKTYGEAVADVMRFLASEGVKFPMTAEEWLAFSQRASFYEHRAKARAAWASHVEWDCEHAKTPGRLLPGARRHRLRDRQVARRGAVRRRPLDGDEDGRPARRQGLRRRDPRGVPGPDARLQPVAVVQLGHDRA